VTRWLWRFGLLVFVALTTMGLWLPPILTHALEKEYHFPEVSIDATVRQNGDLVLEERRTFDFRNGPFTYAYFTVDDPYDRVRDFTITELVDGREVPVEPDYATHSVAYDNFQAMWSYEANDENRTWVFRYRVACAVDVYEDTAHLYWQFIGTGWEKPTSHAVVTVHVPGHVETATPRPTECTPDQLSAEIPSTPLEPGEVRAWGHGPLNGDVTFVDPQTIRYEVRDVPPASYVEGSIVLPADAVPAAVMQPEPRLQSIVDRERKWADGANVLREARDTQVRWVLILLIVVVVAMPLLVLLAAFRDRIQEVPRYLEQPPEDDSVGAAVVWSVWRGHLSPKNAYRAQILRLVRLGAIELKAEGRVTDPKDLTLVKEMDALDLPTRVDQDFQMLLFGTGEDAVDEVSVNHPKPKLTGSTASVRYQHWWRGAREKSGDTIRRIQKGDARLESTLAFVIAGGAACYGIWTAVWGLGGGIGWWLVPASALEVIAALRAIPARVERPIRERVAKLAAFRRYLQRFSDLPNAPAMAVVIWDRYLEWAVALDVADEVEKQVKALVPVEQLRSPIPGGPTGLGGLNALHGLNAAAPLLVMHSMASASSGSTGGGFGSSGGFSGGGGGGGGGTGGGAG
jgi:uncharacterized membrane protein